MDIEESAVVIRPVRMLTERFQNYTSFIMPNSTVKMWLNRLKIMGPFPKESKISIDLLNKKGDIIHEIPLNKKQFEYLRSKLKFRVDHN